MNDTRADLSLPLIALLLLGGVPDTTGSNFSYAQVEPASWICVVPPRARSRTRISDSFVQPSGDATRMIYETFDTPFATQNLSSNTVKGNPAEWAQNTTNLISAFCREAFPNFSSLSESQQQETARRGGYDRTTSSRSVERDRGPIDAWAELESAGSSLSPDEVDRLVVARRTLAHRKAKDRTPT